MWPLELLPGRYAVCRLPSDAKLPDWSQSGAFSSITRSPEELSIVCDEAAVPSDVKQDRGWRCFKLQGPLELDLTGVLAGVLEPLAKAGVSILAIATYDTDYVLARDAQLERAIAALQGAGYDVERSTS